MLGTELTQRPLVEEETADLPQADPPAESAPQLLLLSIVEDALEETELSAEPAVGGIQEEALSPAPTPEAPVLAPEPAAAPRVDNNPRLPLNPETPGGARAVPVICGIIAVPEL